MKTLYIDCAMGAAGDMLTAALLELLPDPKAFVDELNGLGIPGVVYSAEPSEKCGIRGTHMTVKVNGEEEESLDVHEHEHHDHDHDHEHHHDHDHDHEHHHDHEHEHSHGGHTHSHSGLHDIEHIVRDHLALPDKVKDDVMAVYGLIAEAESRVHGTPVSEIHFHEVGTADAVADITAVCLLMNRLAPDQVVVSPVHVGSGQVRCAHGILPVPAPATAYILRDVPIYGGTIKGELCTPTGAALLKHFATGFGSMPVMKPEAIGYGMGKKDFEAANCVRVIMGETGQSVSEVRELLCNIDDMTGEEIGFATELFMKNGALDVYTVPIGMKKSRPGILLAVMCREADRDRLLSLIFRHTTTLGVRETVSKRYTMDRGSRTVSTDLGDVRMKRSTGYGTEKVKFEYEDLVKIAKENDLSLFEARRAAEKAAGLGQTDET